MPLFEREEGLFSALKPAAFSLGREINKITGKEARRPYKKENHEAKVPVFCRSLPQRGDAVVRQLPQVFAEGMKRYEIS